MSWPSTGVRPSGSRSSRTATGSPVTCMTSSSRGCTPPACRCRARCRSSAHRTWPNRVSSAVDALDETIREIRSAIFALQTRQDTAATGLRARILRISDDMAGSLGFAPALQLEGHLDDVPSDLAEHVLGVLREALSNTARHAGASSVVVRVEAAQDLTLTVTDNGSGITRDWSPQRAAQSGAAGQKVRRCPDRAACLRQRHRARVAGAAGRSGPVTEPGGRCSSGAAFAAHWPGVWSTVGPDLAHGFTPLMGLRHALPVVQVSRTSSGQVKSRRQPEVLL